jgi:polyphosphate glucokinase
MKRKKILGIDIGGSGIKGAIVNTKTGELLTDRFRIPTPDIPTPTNVVNVIKEIVQHFKWDGLIGIGFPGVIQNGIVRTAANLNETWINANINKLVYSSTGCPTHTVNDADAAGMAEMKFGAGKDNQGLVLVLTIGTGVGTVLFTEGHLVTNLEMGHVYMPNGLEAEKYMSDGARKEYNLEWDEWVARMQEYLDYMHGLLWPDLIIIGGGFSKKLDKKNMPFATSSPIVPAELLNEAGIIGAALTSRQVFKLKDKVIR